MLPLLRVVDLPSTRRGDLAEDMQHNTAPTVRAGVAPAIAFRGKMLSADKGHYGCSHRTCSPEQTMERIRPHLATCGITRIADITGLDRIHHVPVAIAVRPNSHTLANSAGKGTTTISAKVSAAMEGIELHHAENLRLPVWEASFDEVTQQRPHIRQEHLPLRRGSLFRPDQLLRWVDAFDLIGQQETAVPEALVSMRHPRCASHGITSVQMGSNGLASGNELLEAICHGLYEVIERDAVTLTALGDGRQPRLRDRRIDAAAIEYEEVRRMLRDLADRDISVALFDITTDINVPAYVALLIDVAHRGQGIMKGHGCHLDPEIAMVRAITEAVQSRTVYIAGSRDDMSAGDFARMRRGDKDEAARRYHASGIVGDQLTNRLVGTATSLCPSSSFHEDLTHLVDQIRKANLPQVLVADLTDSDMGIPVVRVIVPGLEGHMFPTYQPGLRGKAVLDGNPPRTAIACHRKVREP
jgi:ribosomal protein S12 methylthiotransferase accessory factor